MESVEDTFGGTCRLSSYGVFREQLSVLGGMESERSEN